MGKTLGSFAVKSINENSVDFYKDVLNYTKEILKNAPVDNPDKDRQFFISQPAKEGVWIPLFPCLENVASDNLSNLISKKFNTLAVYVWIYESDDIFIKIYSNGTPIFKYKNAVSKENMKAPAWVGNLEDVLNVFNVDISKQDTLETILKGEKTTYGEQIYYKVDADVQFGKIVDFLGVPELKILQDFGYRYLAVRDTYLKYIETGKIPPTEHVNANI